MSDWLPFIIVVLIIAIVLDGIRRAYANKSQVRLSKNAAKADAALDTYDKGDYLSDFPNGGARKKNDSNIDSGFTSGTEGPAIYNEYDEDISEDTVSQLTHTQAHVAKSYVEPEQASLDLGEPVPILMDPVDGNDNSAEQGHKEPSLGSLNELDADISSSTQDDILPMVDISASQNKVQGSSIASFFATPDAQIEGTELNTSMPSDTTVESESPKKKNEIKSKLQSAANYFNRTVQEVPAEESKAKPPETLEVIVVNVMARSGEMLQGAYLADTLKKLNLKFGEMGVFHFYDHHDSDTPLFSIANIIEPGVFDLSTIDTLETPGLCLFLPLPSPIAAAEAYEQLIHTASDLAFELGGELKDENRSALTKQTIEHGRMRVIEFERKYKLSKQ